MANEPNDVLPPPLELRPLLAEIATSLSLYFGVLCGLGATIIATIRWLHFYEDALPCRPWVTEFLFEIVFSLMLVAGLVWLYRCFRAGLVKKIGPILPAFATAFLLFAAPLFAIPFASGTAAYRACFNPPPPPAPCPQSCSKGNFPI